MIEPTPELPTSAPASSGPIAKGKGWVLQVAAMIVVVMIVGGILFVYFSPKYSWDPSIRDHDGDGVPDAKDPMPYDPNISFRGTATVIVTIQLNQTINQTAHFVLIWLYFDQVGQVNGTVSPGEPAVYTLYAQWLTREVEKSGMMDIDCHSPPSPSHNDIYSVAHPVMLHDGGTYSITLTISWDW